jgi:hypothetical protein
MRSRTNFVRCWQQLKEHASAGMPLLVMRLKKCHKQDAKTLYILIATTPPKVL